MSCFHVSVNNLGISLLQKHTIFQIGLYLFQSRIRFSYSLQKNMFLGVWEARTNVTLCVLEKNKKDFQNLQRTFVSDVLMPKFG